MSISTRLARAQAALKPSAPPRQEMLARYFAGSEYDSQREQLIEALCSDKPAYGWQETDARGDVTIFGSVTWPDRDAGGEPLAIIFRIMDDWRGGGIETGAE